MISINGILTDGAGNPLTYTQMVFKLLGAVFSGTNIAVTGPIVSFTAADGSYNINLQPGIYDVYLGNKVMNRITVPAGGGPYSIPQIVTPGATPGAAASSAAGLNGDRDPLPTDGIPGSTWTNNLTGELWWKTTQGWKH